MKKLLSVLVMLMFIQTGVIAKDTLQFEFPNDGWHQVASPDGVQSKKCFVPYNQTGENYNEMLIFSERTLKNADISALTILHRQLGKDRNNYFDITPEYISNDLDDAMLTWCSQTRNTCVVERAFKGTNGVILAIYQNKAPHYSQNMFGQWSNILKQVKINDGTGSAKNLIELD